MFVYTFIIIQTESIMIMMIVLKQKWLWVKKQKKNGFNLIKSALADWFRDEVLW